MSRDKLATRRTSLSPRKRSVIARKTSKQNVLFTNNNDEKAVDASLALTPPLRKPYFRIPKQVTMGRQHYSVRRSEDVVGCAVPKLRLSGRWLEHCGFAVGDALRVTVGRGVLLISREPPVVPVVKHGRRRAAQG